MSFYRKKPVVVEARLFAFTTANVEAGEQLAKWCGGLLRGVTLPPEQWEIEIPTREGDMRASFGDYIIKGVKGEFYPCKPDIFEQTYEFA